MTDAPARFDKIATNYATSEVHTSSPTMQRLHALVSLPEGASVVDVACGAGHMALSFSKRAARIVGVDPAPGMLAAFQELAASRGVAVEATSARAESIPLPAETFDIVVSRLAPHHFADIQKAVREMARLAKAGGYVAVIDLEGDADPAIDEFNHRLEVLHDPTHVRSYTSARWRELFEGAGLLIEALESNRRESAQGVPVRRWCEIASSGSAAEQQIRAILMDTPQATLDALMIGRAGDEFLIPVRTVLIVGRKPMTGA